MTRKARIALAVCCALALGGCGRAPRWTLPVGARVADRDVARALDDRGGPPPRRFDPSTLPLFPAPAHTRPCCVFGAGLQVEVGKLPVPGLSLANLRSAGDIGLHRYDGGAHRIGSPGDVLLLTPERNGLVYTCRGGFIDTAHVRDYADLAFFLAIAIARLSERGGEFALAPQGGTLRVRVRPFPLEQVEIHGLRKLVEDTAQWLAFQVSIWHEIATWYGYESFPGFSEKVSAFSPEDLYSNLVGIKIARGLVETGPPPDELAYARLVDDWITMVLARLGAVPVERTARVMETLDGVWWDSSKRVPDWTLVRRRDFQVRTVEPWTVERAFGVPPDEPLLPDCEGGGALLPLRAPEGVEGIRFAQIATLEIDVDETLLASGLPLADAGRRAVTEQDLPRILEAIRVEHTATFGPLGDRPERVAP